MLKDDTASKGRRWLNISSQHLLSSLGAVVFIVCLFVEVLSLAPPAMQPVPEVMLDELNDSTPSDSGCLPMLHESFLGIPLPNESHYCPRGGSLYFEPIPGCLLAPPQPYWFSGLLSTCKGVGIFLFMRTKIKEKYSFFEKNKTMIMAWVTCGITVASVGLLVKKAWGFNVPTHWEHYQCFGIICSNAPWTVNLMLVGLICLMVSDASKNQNISAQARAVFDQKKKPLGVATIATMASLLFFLGPFVVTNLFWAFLLGGCVPLGCGIIIYFTSWKCTSEQFTSMDSVHLERSMNGFVLVTIPGAIVCGFAIQWMAAASSYIETGQYGFFESVAVATVERRSDLYMQNLQNSVLNQGTWCMEMVNEVWP